MSYGQYIPRSSHMHIGSPSMCPVWQAWAAPVDGMFNDAENWVAKKVPQANDVVVAKGDKMLTVSKNTCVCVRVCGEMKE